VLDAASRRRSLNRRFENILQTLERTSDQTEGLTEATKKLLRALEALVVFARNSVEQRWTDTETLPEPSREMTRRLTADDVTYLMQEFSTSLLPAVDGAVSSNVPVELEALVRRLIAGAAGRDDLNVILFSSSEINYSIQLYPDPVQDIAALIAPHASMPPASGDDFLFLRLPRLERDSALLHAIMLGHEVGHLLDWTHSITGGLSPTAPPSWFDPSSGDLLPTNTDDYDEFVQTLINWSSEVVADVVAALTFGPASLLALSEIVLSIGPVDSDSETHPGADRRFAIALKVLDRTNFDTIDDLRPVLSTFREISATALTRPTNTGGDGTQEAWNWIAANLDALIQRCYVGPASSPDLAHRWDDVRQAAERLAAGLPCGEVIVGTGNQAAPVAVAADAIVNAGWRVVTSMLDALAAVVDADTTDDAQLARVGLVLDGLVLKSLEIAELRRERPW
jgi:hypothetical protein